MQYHNATNAVQQILGIEVGNLQFHYAVNSDTITCKQPTGEPLEKPMFAHNKIVAEIEFDSFTKLDFGTKYKHGSLFLMSVSACYDVGSNNIKRFVQIYRYRAVLVQGKETQQIAQAIATDLTQ